MIPNARLVQGVDRSYFTDRANIIETGTDSYRFRRTLEKRKARNPESNTITVAAPAERRREKWKP